MAMQRDKIPDNVIIGNTHTDLQRVLDYLHQAEPIMVQPSGDWPAYVIEAEALDEAKSIVKRLLHDFKRINRR